jgi:hypothetical protein
MRSLILAGCALIAVGIANVDIKPHPTRTVRVPQEVVKTRTVYAPAKPGDGYMTSAQCHALRTGERFTAVLARYGWPAGSNAKYGDYDSLSYPMSHDPESDDECEIGFDEGGVTRVHVDDDGNGF